MCEVNCCRGKEGCQLCSYRQPDCPKLSAIRFSNLRKSLHQWYRVRARLMAVASPVGRDWTQLCNREFEYGMKYNRPAREERGRARRMKWPSESRQAMGSCWFVAGTSRRSPTPGLPWSLVVCRLKRKSASELWGRTADPLILRVPSV